MLGSRLVRSMLIAALVLTGAACEEEPQPPEFHGQLRATAASLTIPVKIRCSKDMWERTGARTKIEAKVTEGEFDTVTAEFSGTQLSELLQALSLRFDELDEDDPVAERMYYGIAVQVEPISRAPYDGGKVPVIDLDYAEAIASSRPDSPRG